MKKKNENREVQFIETNRLVLRDMCSEDHKDAYELDCDRETGLMMDRWLEDDMFRGMKRYPVIALNKRNKLIGKFDISYYGPRSNEVINACWLHYFCIRPQYRRQGYGQEFLEGLTSYVFEKTETNLIFTDVLEINKPAIALLEKVGFVQEGVLHKAGYYPGLGAVDKVSLYLEKQ